MYRHGDVLLQKIETIPDGFRKQGSNIVAEGEVTGHAHRLTNGVVLADAGRRVLQVDEGGHLTHEEHNRLDMEPGIYSVTIQREYDDENEWREVAD